MRSIPFLLIALMLLCAGCKPREEALAPGVIRFCKVNYEGGKFRGEFEYPVELLEELQGECVVKITLQKNILDLSDPAILGYDVIYLTGRKDFHFREDERKMLVEFLNTGGFLIADACSAHQEFDAAFRREMSRALPGLTLSPLKSNQVSIASLVVPGASLTIVRSCPNRAFNSMDFPTLGRPAIAIFIASCPTSTGTGAGNKEIILSNNSAVPRP